MNVLFMHHLDNEDAKAEAEFLTARGYRLLSWATMNDPAWKWNGGRTPLAHQLHYNLVMELLGGTMICVLHESCTPQVQAQLRDMCPVVHAPLLRMDQLELWAADMTTALVYERNLAPQKEYGVALPARWAAPTNTVRVLRERVRTIWQHLLHWERKLNAHIGQHLKNPMARQVEQPPVRPYAVRQDLSTTG